MGGQTVSVLVVDDSALMRNLITRILSAEPDIRVVGTAMNGLFALKKIETLRPDLIVLDLEMPEMNGIQFLKERRRRGLSMPVIILSSIAERGAKITMEALANGASDFLLKPSGAVQEGDLRETAVQLVGMVRAYGGRHAGREAAPAAHRSSAAPPEPVPAAPVPFEPHAAAASKTPAGIELIAIGISTGGPNALRVMLPDLDPAIRASLLIVQHMPVGFTREFAESLARICPLEVREAADGDLIRPGRILIAPGDSHMTVESRPLSKTVRLSDAPPVNGHRPSVDVMFASVARSYGNRCMAVLMTGMGKDGAAEIGTIHRQGGVTVAQDESSCVVYGMPKAAIESGYAQHIVPLSRMAETVNRLSREHPPE
jgi:two-component system, chemotaxis family, protein-glutamate methylesterase/glutaminase